MSQTNLADGVGVTYQQIQKYENGMNRIGAGRLQQIAQILQVPVPYFFEGAPAAAAPSNRNAAPLLSIDYATKLLATSEGLALSKAFIRIQDVTLRRRIVALVKQIAGEDDN